ncbi:MAG: glucose-6-phosphate isomerase [Acidobacteriota bacterium]|nr:glucose-6-phosphate isomerase [Acidobacteriota bacterium]
MNDQSFKPVTYDPSNVLIEGTGLSASELTKLAPRLVAARDEVLADLEMVNTGATVPSAKQPLDAGFIDLPDRLLAAYRSDNDASEVGRIISAAQRLGEMVDRFVVIGIGGSYMGARSLFESCCHPYHNELSREARRGKPRMYFVGNNVDNDDTQGLLDVLGRGRRADGAGERWGVIVVSKSGGTLEPAVALRQFLSFMRQSLGDDQTLLPKLVIPVTGRDSNLFNLVTELGCDAIFDIPDNIGGRYSILTAVGLAPAAVLGLDIVKLLEGAAAMNARFRTASPGENPVLDYVGVCHLMEAQRAATIRVMTVWSQGLEALGMWYDQLLSESLGKDERGATPLTAVNTRDLHSRGQQHQQGRRDKLITNVVLDEFKREPLPVGSSGLNQDNLNAIAEKTMPELMSAAINGTKRAYREDRRPTADIHLPRSDEASIGQLYQMLMLATIVEGRLIGINPYGQPGVEAYKKHMKSILSGEE